ncbi:MAG: aminotransferase class V-fold PLP-dependent enzyme [Coriobacteriales bacterium]|jgi:cysteine desulfurase family protein|nr:aminotransferase class V-fold PLP-dependent enzyme [Coriobacteriales bacterium]
MIYFDNAATTLAKPPGVLTAVQQALGSFGAAGRGAHTASLAAGRAIYKARERVAWLLGAPSPQRVAFCANATEALNIVLSSLARPGSHALTTAAAHNSILRPLYRQAERGARMSILPVAADGSIDYAAFADLFEADTNLAVVTHNSNVTGDVYDIARMAEICHAHGALLAVDAAQTAGILPLDMAEMGIDILVFTGHKGLYGIQGTGGLCLAEGVELEPLVVGGSGLHSFDHQHPTLMPERLEAGTANAHGLAALAAGCDYLIEVGVAEVRSQSLVLARHFEAGARRIPGVRIYGGQADVQRSPIVALNVGSEDSAAISDRLDMEYGICTRPGVHCAPLMHEALGTAEQGAVRFSFSHLNTVAEVDKALAALEQVSQTRKRSRCS